MERRLLLLAVLAWVSRGAAWLVKLLREQTTVPGLKDVGCDHIMGSSGQTYRWEMAGGLALPKISCHMGFGINPNAVKVGFTESSACCPSAVGLRCLGESQLQLNDIHRYLRWLHVCLRTFGAYQDASAEMC